MGDKWMQGVKARMKKKGTEGSLRKIAKSRGKINKEGNISKSWLESMKNAGGTLGKKVNLALVFAQSRGGKKKKSPGRRMAEAAKK